MATTPRKTAAPAAKKTAAKKATTAARSATARKVAQPADHQEKVVEAAEKAVEFLTVEIDGREWKVPVAALDDFELLDDFNALEQNDDPTRMPAVMRRLLGADYAEAMNVIRDPKTGRVSVDAGTEFCLALVRGLNPNS